MYIVVSKWGVESGKEESFRETGKKMRAIMRKTPGVEYVESIKCEDGNALAIVGYKDEATYKSIMAEGGPFETAAQQNNLENAGKWMWSERGEAVDREAAMA
jgi:antibiotic biosynthesis monooxygenase (ABM) superfamily enzyme